MMTEDTVEYNSLRWVKKELDHILHEAQVSLSAYIENPADKNILNECIDHLHMVQGTLQMVELYGAAQMAEEMEQLASAVVNDQVSKLDDAYDVLMRAMLQLPDYLESLQAGNKDVPMVLLPILNDLRAARNESLLSENVLFFPDIDANDADIEIESVELEAGALSALAKKLRPHFQVGLIGWFKGDKIKTSLQRMLVVLNELEKNSANHSLRRLWNVSAALVEGLVQDGLDVNVSVKMLLGQVDRSIKELIDKGEEAFTEKSSRDLLKNLLYYVGRVTGSSPRVDKVKDVYKLSQLLPTDSELEEARAGLGGLNEELLNTVSQGIREDLLEVKDVLEIFVHSEDHDVEKLKSLPELLSKIADTLAMLGLGEQRENVNSQKQRIEALIANGGGQGADTEVMEIAGVLLSAESQLNNFIASKSGSAKGIAKDKSLLDMDAMPEADYDEVLSVVIREALHNFSDARQSILNYLNDTSQTDLLRHVLQRLDEIKGAMNMLPIQRLEIQINALENYISRVLIGKGLTPDAEAQDDIAFIITSVEYYLEALLEGRPNIELSMTAGENAANKLNEIAEKHPQLELADEIDSGKSALEELVMEAPAVEQQEAKEEISKEDVSGKEKERPKVQQPPAASSGDQAFAILDGDGDEEILEIFIEEALEELTSLNEQLPLWINNPNDEEALSVIRRSFHTLKGSGRLIGAQLIGEFAWKFENMLNRVIDQTIFPDKELFNSLEEALGVLPQLIEQLKGNQEPVENVYELMQVADAISSGRAVPERSNDVAKSDVSTNVQLEAAAVEDSDDLSFSEELTDADNELFAEESLSIDEDYNAEALDLSEDLSLNEFSNLGELTDLNEDLSINETGSADELLELSEGFEEGALELTDDLGGVSLDLNDGNLDLSEISDMDEVLDLAEDLSLVEEDSVNAIESSDDFDLGMSLEADESLDLSEDLSLTEELDVASLDLDYEQNADAADLSGLDIEDDFDVDLTDDLDALQLASADDNDEFAIEFETEDDLIDLGAIDDENAALNLMESSLDDDVLPIHADPVLFEIFNKESLTHLEKIRELLGPENAPLRADHDLTRALHTLFGSARTAQVEEIAELCGSAEKYVKSVIQEKGENAELNSDAVECIAEIEQVVRVMLDQLANPASKLDRRSDLLERIKSLPVSEVSQQTVGDDVLLDVVDIPVQVASSSEESLVAYSDVDDELVDIFLEEADELLDGCENCLQRWTSNQNDNESVQELQRLLHTLKGGARMADLAPVGDLTHAFESLIISVNDGRVGFSRAMGHLLHDSMDRLSDMMAKVKNREPMLTAEALINHLDALRRGEEVDIKKKPDILAEVGKKAAETVEQQEPAPVFDDEVDLTSELSIEEDSTPDEVVELSFEESPLEKLLDDTVKTRQPVETTQDEPAGKSMATEQVRVRSDLLNELVNHAGEVSVFHARMGQQITNFSFNLSEMDQTIVRLREQLRQLTIETEAQILSRYEKETDQYDEHFDPLEMDRFSTMQQISRSLQETVGDMESIKDIVNEDIRDAEMLLLQESRVSTELQEGLMRTRMVHFGGLASRLRRIVRQTSREMAKDVELEINGESSEVDRTVLDRIVAPLEHMLRNAVAHGIELPKDRLAAGKPEVGNIHIYVDREGGDVVMKVVDDGKGIDVSAIRKKAIEKGFIESGSKISDHDVLQFIMEPGFSTAEKVTQIAGRGVGMDVVDSEIKQLGGVLEIDTVKGKGTTFTIRLPLTLAINHALLVMAGDDIYAVPLNSIKGVVRMAGPELQSIYDTVGGRYEFAGVEYELKQLNFLLNGQQSDYSMRTELFPVLLVHVGDQKIALHVEDLIGRREVVVKPVGPQISTVRGISGATILGDGRVVLILEMNNLVLGEALFHVAGEEAVEMVEAVEEDIAPLVMVVDDSITIRKVTARMLERNGMRVITAKDGVDAVSQLQELVPDIMLLDIEMPRMDGYEVATHVRSDARTKEMPIIMITSRTGAKHRDKAMEIGVNSYLGKPYQEDELMENINSLLG